MLSCDEQAELAVALCATAETLGHTLSAGAAELMAEDLADYQLEDIAAALRACRRELTGKLTLAAILQRVQAADGRPEPNEAWSIALGALDEYNSAMLTDEIREALGKARPVFQAGDKIGARMAFLSAYQRQLDDARRQSRPVRWSLSEGFNPELRIRAVQEAARTGLLSAPEAATHLARLTHAPITADGAAIAGLLTGSVVHRLGHDDAKALPSKELSSRLQTLKADVLAYMRQSRADRDREQADRKAAFERRRSEAVKAVEQAQAVRG